MLRFLPITFLISVQLCYGQHEPLRGWSLMVSGHMYKGVGRAMAVRSNSLTALGRYSGGMAGLSIQAEHCISQEVPILTVGLAAGVEGVEAEGWNMLGLALGQIGIRLRQATTFNNWYIGYGWTFGEVHFDSAQSGAWVFRSGIHLLDTNRWRVMLDYQALRTRSHVNHIGVNGQVLYQSEVSPRFSAIGIATAYKFVR